MNSALIVFDGNAPAQNLLQEAKNGRCKCRIFVNPRSRELSVKARMLEGYVESPENPERIISTLAELSGT